MTAEREESDYGATSDATDNVSLNDTEASDLQSEYSIDCILDEGDFDVESPDGTVQSEKLYLIKWSGYSRYRASWEPAANFISNGRDALHEWQEEKMRRERGFKQRFDYTAFENWRRDITARRVRRHGKRNKRRRLLGRATVHYSSDEDEDNDVEYEDEDPIISSDDHGDDNRIFFSGGHRKRRVLNSSSDTSNDPVYKRRRPSDFTETSRGGALQLSTPNDEPSRQTSASMTVLAKATTAAEKSALKPGARLGQRPPPIARMAGGPLRRGIRLLTGHTKPIFRNVFVSGSTQSRKTSGARIIQPKQFRNLSHQNNARKRSMREAVPNMEKLNLKDLATGETISSAVTRTAATRVAPSAALTCWFWKTSYCRHGESCGLEHYNTGRVAELKNRSRSEITCPRWFNGTCFKPANGCIYAHNVTEYLASDGNNPIRKLDVQKAREVVASKYDAKDPNSLFLNESLPHGYKALTCWYWFFQGWCRFEAGACQFAHQIREYIAGRRGEENIPTRDHPNLHLRRSETATEDAHARLKDVKDDTVARPSAHILARRPENSPSPPPRLPSADSAQHLPFVLPFTTVPPGSPNQVSGGKQMLFKSGELTDQENTVTARRESDVGLSPTVLISLAASKEMKSVPNLDIRAMLTGMDLNKAKKFNETLGIEPTLTFTHMCCGETLERYFDVSTFQKLASGLVSAVDRAESSLENLANNLKDRSGGAICFSNELTVVVFPTGQSVWKFLGSLPSTGTSAKLQFQLLSPLKLPANSLTALRTPHQPPVDVDMQLLLSRFDNNAEKNVFMLVSPANLEKFTSLMLSLCQHGAKVYTASKKGSWEFFYTTYRSGVVLFEADFNSFHQVRKLHAGILVNRFNIFRIIDEVQPPSFEPLFLHGQAVYFSDSCFQEQPNDTLKALNQVKERLKHKQASQILGRPGLLDWLLKITAAEKEVGQQYNYERHKAIFELLSKILDDYLLSVSCKRDFQLRSTGVSPRSAPPDDCPLYYLSPAVLPEFDELWRRAGNDPSTPAKADDVMISWYAGWAVTRASTYRRFLFLTRAPEHQIQGWKDKYRHLDITTVDKYLANV